MIDVHHAGAERGADRGDDTRAVGPIALDDGHRPFASASSPAADRHARQDSAACRVHQEHLPACRRRTPPSRRSVAARYFIFDTLQPTSQRTCSLSVAESSRRTRPSSRAGIEMASCRRRRDRPSCERESASSAAACPSRRRAEPGRLAGPGAGDDMKLPRRGIRANRC
ncbi:hypothetical protein OUZ56_027548 [Daphnia magna]|uniref:Uncharacterized protein n=1 Tax=Daphnia magna TaxID=35525 RepID=A0ABQ9ZQ29_9CRUS|nr:hypothetical protein OUZ56_027548 [Daphnia magna]